MSTLTGDQCTNFDDENGFYPPHVNQTVEDDWVCCCDGVQYCQVFWMKCFPTIKEKGKKKKGAFKCVRRFKKTFFSCCLPLFSVVDLLREGADDDLRPLASWVISRHELLKDRFVVVVVAAESLDEAPQAALHGHSQRGILQTHAHPCRAGTHMKKQLQIKNGAWRGLD